jgi:hypothetical protein
MYSLQGSFTAGSRHLLFFFSLPGRFFFCALLRGGGSVCLLTVDVVVAPRFFIFCFSYRCVPRYPPPFSSVPSLKKGGTSTYNTASLDACCGADGGVARHQRSTWHVYRFLFPLLLFFLRRCRLFCALSLLFCTLFPCFLSCGLCVLFSARCSYQLTRTTAKKKELRKHTHKHADKHKFRAVFREAMVWIR